MNPLVPISSSSLVSYLVLSLKSLVTSSCRFLSLHGCADYALFRDEKPLSAATRLPSWFIRCLSQVSEDGLKEGVAVEAVFSLTPRLKSKMPHPSASDTQATLYRPDILEVIEKSIGDLDDRLRALSLDIHGELGSA